LIFERTDGSKGQLYPVFLNFPLSRHDQAPDSLSWHSHLPQPQPSFLVRQLPPQHPAVGFCLTHKVEPPIVDRQKRDFLSYHIISSHLPKNIRTVSLWSENELFVIPPESAIYKGSKAIDMTPFTHYSYLIHPKCWRTVSQIL